MIELSLWYDGRRLILCDLAADPVRSIADMPADQPADMPDAEPRPYRRIMRASGVYHDVLDEIDMIRKLIGEEAGCGSCAANA